ncbi:MAG: sulfite exporter TauE/SafE family protein [Luteimonas sp.]
MRVSIDWLTLGAAALAGLMGSLHCAAMCGGIATGFSAMASRTGWRQALEPNIGRVLGYVLAGAAAGALGSGVIRIARSEWLALGLRSAVGVVLIVVAIRLLDRQGRMRFLARGGVLWAWLRPLQKRLLPADTTPRRIALGMLWGWLPCGLSTTLLMAAWLQADALKGAATMAAFGVGTLPMMLPLTWSGARVGQRLQRGGWRVAAGTLVMAAGLLTLSGPWLMQVPQLSGPLAALGCHALPR